MVDHSEPVVAAGLDIDHPSGPVAESVSWGVLAWPIVLRTHGGSARAIECGQPKIDVAFIVVLAADNYGNANGVGGPNACGSLGYAFPDAQYADRVVAVTDTPQGAATASRSSAPARRWRRPLRWVLDAVTSQDARRNCPQRGSAFSGHAARGRLRRYTAKGSA